eukprot:Gregarina_sp_Poly_1__7399@NODE_4099_length_730_cov_41_045249_g2682_i0_p1_GENE_NODE_4099_length_730_cov_41_045249_g2682_i0NODE_4099_length_730_cov_41_045249_g2682_i0_p1_ORF_typecomplete_len202_score31_58GAD/PF02938_14/26GAD/PF02938_14/1_4DUF2095/PF09868_9/0_18_NODE_4099_length_730_cov_41_045249_g2682_i024629
MSAVLHLDKKPVAEQGAKSLQSLDVHERELLDDIAKFAKPLAPQGQSQMQSAGAASSKENETKDNAGDKTMAEPPGELTEINLQLADDKMNEFANKFGHAGLYLQVEQLKGALDAGEDSLMASMRMLERFQSSTGASGITHEEVSKLREQLRRSALLAFAAHRHSDVLMHAAECYKLTKNYLIKRAGTSLHSDMVRPCGDG